MTGSVQLMKKRTIVNDKNNLSFTIKPPADKFDICEAIVE